MDKKIVELENELNQIKKRNKKVELDKAWETSMIRRIFIAVLTYFVIVLFFYISGLWWNPFMNAIIPTIWFLLSTLSLNVIKKIWIKNYK